MIQYIPDYLIVIAVALLVAHLIKYLIDTIRGETTDFWHQLFRSGGMPSSHAAITVAFLTLVGLKEGIYSGLFGLSALLTLIVCYDAVKVRRSTGEQGDAIKQLIEETHSRARIPRAAKGHTPVEVAAGMLLGVVIGYVVYIATL